MPAPTVGQTNLSRLEKIRSGKVRELYDMGDRLLMVATDRISAFDWVLPDLIPDKGRVLTALTNFWFDRLPKSIPHHRITCDLDTVKDLTPDERRTLAGRSMVVRKAKPLPVECVVRGYISGSGWSSYQKTGRIEDVPLPKGLRESDKLPEPVFTPSTKAEQGHDEPIGFDTVAGLIGKPLAEEVRRRSLEVYRWAADLGAKRGILIADTKFEWGMALDELLLIDEVLTPDSSRFWDAKAYAPGGAQASFDKQFVRDYLLGTGWDRASPPPALPREIVEKTASRYREALGRLAG
ncbi:MAG: phosphoribosylaminoimidazolesuccinocarboxamide synthase [Planctomycetes bacterium]|nr:phosphoribosylaminoimidazolesuccinocarboxamide synthase [Planctomycetota bacterium]